jgi:hypothetical protein
MFHKNTSTMSNPAETTPAPWQGNLPFDQALRLVYHQNSLEQTFTIKGFNLRNFLHKAAQVLPGDPGHSTVTPNQCRAFLEKTVRPKRLQPV